MYVAFFFLGQGKTPSLLFPWRLFSSGNCLLCDLGSIFSYLMGIFTSVFIFSESRTLIFHLSIVLCVCVCLCLCGVLFHLFLLSLTLYIYNSTTKNLLIFYLLFALHMPRASLIAQDW